jgi:hypothetical protein
VLLEGVAYNLFREQQAFDWQLGSGKGGLASGVGLIGIPSFMNNMSGGGETGLTTELAIANLVPKPGFTDFAIYIYDQNGLLDYVCEKLNEKQVEYINVADDWNYINDGFKGSAVISATFWEHDVFDGRGQFVRNLVGLAAVKVERFNWPLVPSTDPADDAPGDQASASEGFPVPGVFDFEGPQAPACPGVGEGICLTDVVVLVTADGTAGGAPVAFATVQLRSGGIPVATGVTDATGFVTIPNVPVPNPGVTSYDVFVAPTPGDALADTNVNTGALNCPVVNPPTVVVPDEAAEFDILGFVFTDADADFIADVGETRWENVTVILQESDTADEIDTETTEPDGRFEFDDVDPTDCPAAPAGCQLKVLLTNQAGQTASYLSVPFQLTGAYDAIGVNQPNFDTDGDPATGGEAWGDPDGAFGP